MAEDKIHQYGLDLTITRHCYNKMKNTSWSNDVTTDTLKTLLTQLGGSLQKIGSIETHATIPLFREVRHDLSICTSSDTTVSHEQLHSLVDNLARYNAPLDKIIQLHISALTEIKVVELTSQQAEQELVQQANQLKEKAKQRKIEGAAVGIIGGLLLYPTLGASLPLVTAGRKDYRTGDQAMQQYRTIKAELGIAFGNLKRLVTGSIDVVQILAGMINTLAQDIKGMSNAKTKLELLRIRAKASRVSCALAQYIALSESSFGGEVWFPYALRGENPSCNECNKVFEGDETFYHCSMCSSYDLCVECYRVRQHSQDHSFSKHSKAQSLIQQYRVCDSCEKVIQRGRAQHCSKCEFDLCGACVRSGRGRHNHALEEVNIKWYTRFEVNDVKCDECGESGMNSERMFQCLECYWYFICSECKKDTAKHPHELVGVDME